MCHETSHEHFKHVDDDEYWTRMMNQGRIDIGGDDNKSTHKQKNDGDNGDKSAGEQLAMKIKIGSGV